MLKKAIRFLGRPKENFPNWLILKYHLLKTFKKIVSRDKLDPNKKLDMFDWSLYNLHFRGEVKEMKKNFTVTLKPGDYTFNGEKLEQANKGIKPMHPLYRLLYETILQLKPAAILEIGCGAGLHLKNINTLASGIELHGFDRSNDQINYLRELFPDLKADVFTYDATEKYPEKKLPDVDLAYTLAVVMHIHEDQAHLRALANIFNSAKNHVVLVERWKNHNFMEDITNLRKQNIIKWHDIHFHIRRDDNDPNFCLMVCSKSPLNYEKAVSYDVFPKK